MPVTTTLSPIAHKPFSIGQSVACAFVFLEMRALGSIIKENTLILIFVSIINIKKRNHSFFRTYKSFVGWDRLSCSCLCLYVCVHVRMCVCASFSFYRIAISRISHETHIYTHTHKYKHAYSEVHNNSTSYLLLVWIATCNISHHFTSRPSR